MSVGKPAGTPSVKSVSPAPRGALRRYMRIVRPVLLITVAAGGFAGLLRWHHARFEAGIVDSFQQYQLNSAHSLGAAMEGTFDDAVKNLSVMSTYPEIRAGGGSAKAAIDSYYQLNSDLLQDVVMLDASGEVMHESPLSPVGAAGRNTKSPYGAGDASAVKAVFVAPPRGDNCVHVVLPVHCDGQAIGTINAAISVQKVAAKCHSRANDMSRGSCWMIDADGAPIYGVGAPTANHTVRISRGQSGSGGDESASAASAPAYLAQACAKGGRSGQAEMLDPSGAGGEQLISFTPITLGGNRYALVMASPKAGISVPLLSHERVTYALIVALALLYFATGYMAYRGESVRNRQEQERRLAAEEASKAKGEFLARMSHEIRTPMNGIIGMTDLALQTPLDQTQRRYLGVVKESAGTLLAVINDILDFSKIEARRMELLIAPLRLRDCLAAMLAPLEPVGASKGLALRWRAKDDVPEWVMADGLRLRQVITNLVGNAVKFTEQGQVSLNVDVRSAGPGGVELHFAVSDTGPGIGPDKVGRIFSAFEQGDVYVARKHGGTGLGLAISRQLVELMGGRIWVDSALGAGSTFHFTTRHAAPSAAEITAATAKPEADTSHATARALRILVAEDNPVNQELVATLLTTWGHMVLTAVSGTQAVAAMEKQKFDLVLMDVQMPGMTGLEATEIIRRQEQDTGKHVQIIAMTAHALEGDQHKCFAAGMDGYISKPISADAFKKVIDAIARGESQSGGGKSQPDGGVARPTAERVYPQRQVHDPEPEATWDIDAALANTGGDRPMLRKLVEVFLKDNERAPAAMRKLAYEGRTVELSKMAHKIKSSLGVLGAKRAAGLAAQIEAAGLAAPQARAVELVDGLDAELAVVAKAMQSFLEEKANASACG